MYKPVVSFVVCESFRLILDQGSPKDNNYSMTV